MSEHNGLLGDLVLNVPLHDELSQATERLFRQREDAARSGPEVEHVTSRANRDRLPPDPGTGSPSPGNLPTTIAKGGTALRRIAFGLLLAVALAALAVGLRQQQWLTVHHFGAQI